VGPAKLKNSKSNLNLIRFKHYHPSLQKFEIKYHKTWIELRNKLCHWRFFKLENKFELKIRESKGVDFFEFN
jgi:hypothetical protein